MMKICAKSNDDLQKKSLISLKIEMLDSIIQPHADTHTHTAHDELIACKRPVPRQKQNIFCEIDDLDV